jgi:hypothetical protein
MFGMLPDIEGWYCNDIIITFYNLEGVEDYRKWSS